MDFSNYALVAVLTQSESSGSTQDHYCKRVYRHPLTRKVTFQVIHNMYGFYVNVISHYHLFLVRKAELLHGADYEVNENDLFKHPGK